MSLRVISNNEWNKNEHECPKGRVGHSLHFYYEINLCKFNNFKNENINIYNVKNDEILKKKKKEENNFNDENISNNINDKNNLINDNNSNNENNSYSVNNFNENLYDNSYENSNENNLDDKSNNSNNYIYRKRIEGKYKLVLFGGGLISNKFIENYGNIYIRNNEYIFNKLDNIENKTIQIENYLIETFNDIYIYEEKFNQIIKWQNITTYNNPSPRAFHASCIVNLGLNGVFLFIHGGKINNNLLADNSLYALNLSKLSFNNKKNKKKKNIYIFNKNIDYNFNSNISNIKNYEYDFLNTSNINDIKYIDNNISNNILSNSNENILQSDLNNLSNDIKFQNNSTFSSSISKLSSTTTLCSNTNISNSSILQSNTSNQESTQIRYQYQKKKEIKMRWKEIPTGIKGPESRYGHTMNFLYPYIVLFGGNEKIYDLENINAKDDLWVLNLEKLKKNNFQFLYIWKQVEYKTVNPSGRFFHSTCTWYNEKKNKNYLILYGGKMINNSNRNRLFVLEKKKKKWFWSVLPIYVNCLNEYRAYHSIVNINNYIFIIGGEEYKYKYIHKIPSAIYCLETKKIQYIENFSSRMCLKCFVKDDIIYYWGGFCENCINKEHLPNNFLSIDSRTHILEIQMKENFFFDENNLNIIKAESDSNDMYNNINNKIEKLEKKQKYFEKKIYNNIKINNNLNNKMKTLLYENKKLLQLLNFKHKQNSCLFELLKNKNNYDISNNSDNLNNLSNNFINSSENYLKYSDNYNNELLLSNDNEINYISEDKEMISSLNDPSKENNDKINNVNNTCFSNLFFQFENNINNIDPLKSNYLHFDNSDKVNNFQNINTFTNITCHNNDNSSECINNVNKKQKILKIDDNYINNKEKLLNDKEKYEIFSYLIKQQNENINYLNDKIINNNKIHIHNFNNVSNYDNINIINDKANSLDYQNENNLNQNHLETNFNINFNTDINNINKDNNISSNINEKEKISDQRPRRKTAEKCLKLIENDRLNRIKNYNLGTNENKE